MKPNLIELRLGLFCIHPFSNLTGFNYSVFSLNFPLPNIRLMKSVFK